MPTWLNSQKKARLAELAVICNVGDTEELAEWRKDQLVPALEQILSSNPTIYSKIPAFDEYYQRRNSPIKRGGFHPRASSAAALAATANGTGSLARQRKDDMKAETESSEESASSPPNNNNNLTLSSPSVPVAANPRPLQTTMPRTSVPTTTSAYATSYTRPSVTATTAPTFARTPSRLQELQREIAPPAAAPAAAPAAPLPPSPAMVTDLIEAQTAKYYAEVNDIMASTRIIEFFQQVRVELSSMVGIHLVILAFEFYFLQSNVVIWNYLLTWNTPLGSWSIHYPDAFVYLTGHWWKMLLTWQTMSFWIPLVVSWFFNLSLKLKARNGLEYWRPRYKVDPLTFSLAKAVTAWLVFNNGYQFFGLVSEETIARVLISQPLGSQGILVASYVGIATALWDGIQGKKGWQ